MKIINRYIFLECLAYFVISLLTFTGILLTLRMLRFTALIVNRGVAFSQIGAVFISLIPTFLEVAVPLATLLGVMLALGRLSGDSEVIVMRSSGVSILSLVKPVLLFSAISGLITLSITLYLSPWGFQNLARVVFDIARTHSLSGLEHGVFNKLGRLTLYAENIDYRSGELAKVLVDDKRTVEQRKVLTAKGGVIHSDSATRTITVDLKDGYIHELLDGKYILTRYDTNSLVLNSDELFNNGSAKDGPGNRELSLAQLFDAIRDNKDALKGRQMSEQSSPDIAQIVSPGPPGDTSNAVGSEQQIRPEAGLTTAELKRKIRKLRTERDRRFSMPFAAFILGLLALPLGIQVPRTQKAWGAGLSACLGMIVFVIYYALLSIGVALAESGQINSVVALWLPNVVTAIFAVVAIWKVGTEKWHSIPHAIQLAISRTGERIALRGTP